MALASDGVSLNGDLVLPTGATGLVIFAHGSGSSRFSPRNRYVAGVLHDARIGTLLMDLLTMKEQDVDDYTRHLRFDIPLLARRLEAAIDWARKDQATRGLPIGLFGASTGAAAALVAAAHKPADVQAVVSRGGRPDLAGGDLAGVRAPVLMIAGGYDEQVLELNRQAADRLRVPYEIQIVPRATHLFEEPGALEQAAERAREWFIRHLTARTGSRTDDPGK